MSLCDYTDYDYIEEEGDGDFSEDNDVSFTDEPEALTHQSPPLTQCNASLLCSVVPPLHPLTSRVLFHPTFEAYYAAVAIHQNLETPEMHQRRDEGFTVNSGEYFYTDPLLSPGERVYNCPTAAHHSLFGCFRLQTPPPIMAPGIFPSIYDDDPMGDEVEDAEDPVDIGGCIPQSGCAPSPVSGCPVSVSALPSLVLYTESELEAVCALLCLSSGAPHCAH
ncbi:uncharacterized protein LOC130340394 [Hyla sarda]|uniref:uncharacterized protein LOC130340394 n=1 Tax=Hyla sarda TaxID=327740 RepID=UPI0024C32928|nr:uncharacterized protein LOC130340394 [Hyla sarda]